MTSILKRISLTGPSDAVEPKANEPQKEGTLTKFFKRFSFTTTPAEEDIDAEIKKEAVDQLSYDNLTADEGDNEKETMKTVSDESAEHPLRQKMVRRISPVVITVSRQAPASNQPSAATSVLDWDENVECMQQRYKRVQTLRGCTDTITGIGPVNEQTMISTSCDQTIRVWNLMTGSVSKLWHAHLDRVYWLLVMDDDTIVTASADRSIKHWDPSTGMCIQTIVLAHSDAVRRVAKLDDGRIVSGGGKRDKKLKIWNLKTGKCELCLAGHTDAIWAIYQMKDGHIATGSDDDTVRIWEHVPYLSPTTGGKGAFGGSTPRSNQGTPMATPRRNSRSTTVSTESQSIASRAMRFLKAAQSSTAKLMPSKEPEAQLNSLGVGTIRTLKGHKHHVTAICEADGLLCSAALDRTIRVWDLNANVTSGKNVFVRELLGHTNGVHCLCPLFDGVVSLASGSSDSTVRLWNVRMGVCLQVLTGHSKTVERVSLLRDGITIATGGSDKTIQLWGL
jgi:WD40 repeat protein